MIIWIYKWGRKYRGGVVNGWNLSMTSGLPSRQKWETKCPWYAKVDLHLHVHLFVSGLKYLSHGIGGPQPTSDVVGLWPSVFNLATKALISANATCGEGGREDFCRLSDGLRGRCGVCDNFSPDSGKKHLVHYAIDGSSRWWQSPSLANGPEYEYVTITLDLKQVNYTGNI